MTGPCTSGFWKWMVLVLMVTTAAVTAQVDGGWSDWGAWTCSVTCGVGTETRERTCTNPAPANGGANCLGVWQFFRSCHTGVSCSVDGGWSDWGAWSDCSVTCGVGTETRERTCTNPAPANGGANCVGETQETRQCDTRMPCQETCGVQPSGMENAGATITASSTHHHCSTEKARLDSPQTGSVGTGWTGGWCTEFNNGIGEWLQVDLNSVTRIAGVITQGRNDNVYMQWVTSYKLSFSSDGAVWDTYSEQGQEKVFVGNTDKNTRVENRLSPPVTARFVRFHPLTWYSWPSMRMEVLLCVPDTCPENYERALVNGPCLRFSDDVKNYQGAQQTCQDEGARLVVIKSAELNTFIVNRIKTTYDLRTWIGLDDLTPPSGQYRWSDGSVLADSDFEYWAENQPDTVWQEKCGEIWPQADYKWNNWLCDRSQNYICELVEDNFPSMTCDPVLHPPEVNDDKTQVTFTCEIKCAQADPRTRFDVLFLFDNELLQLTPIYFSTWRLRHKLDAKYLGLHHEQRHQKRWISKMGKQLTCGVRTFWKDSPTVKSEMRQSNPYWVGIRASTDPIELDEAAGGYSLQLYATVPFVCTGGSTRWGECYMDVPLAFNANEDDVSVRDACHVRFKASKWDSGSNQIPAETVLIAVKDGQADGNKRMVLNFGEITHGPVKNGGDISPFIYNGYTPKISIQVRTVDTVTGICTSWGDPHIQTFDRKGRWNLVQVHAIDIGEYILYQSTKPDRVFQVQARHEPCLKDVSCNCGVAVREGNDVVIVDRCNGIARSPSYKTVNGLPLSPEVEIKSDQSGNQIRITMPSGAIVKVEDYPFMTITIYAPGIDFGYTEGLCGTFDGNPDNELKMPAGTVPPFASHHVWSAWHEQFSEAWRVPAGTSLFDVDCLPVLPNSPVAESKYCTCGEGKPEECDWTKARRINNLGNINKAVIPKSANGNCPPQRGKRDAQNIENDPLLYNDDVETTVYEFDYGEGFEPEVNDQWPTPTRGITEQHARNFCQESIWNLTIAEVCRDVYGVDILDGVDSCMGDIQATEDFLFADIVVQRVQEECSGKAYINVSLYETNENGTAAPPAIITENLCPRQCSNQGQCVNGSCECNEGYESADCSIQVGRPPVAMQIPASGLCDVRRRPCRKTSFFADGVSNSQNLVCRITEVQIEDGQLVRQESSGRSEAVFRSFAEVSCLLPRSPVRQGTPATNEGAVAHGMWISISNDGERFSEELFFTVYDSYCQECTQGGACTRKPNTCIVRGHCFRNEDANPDNWCQQCLSDLSDSTFSERPVNNPPRFTMTSTTITKLPDESLTITLGAEDPEGRPVTFRAGSPSSPTLTLQPDGELTWTGNEDQPSTINVTIEDECGASSQQMFQLTIMPCPCENGGSCVPDTDMPRGQGFYTCVCPGYTGDMCETELDECQSSPCVNGTCTDLVNGYNCTCAEGYIGPRCDITADNICALEPCFPGVFCTNLGVGNYSCGSCPSGYVGDGYQCEDINECDNDTNGCLHVCRNLPGTFECTCTAGFLLIADECLDVDECDFEIDECSNDCTNTDGSYTCGCPTGYQLNADGITCDDVNECTSSPCQNGGECQDGVSQYTCSCARGWVGTHCEEDIDECVLTNHGCEHQCANTPGSYVCTCPTGNVLSDDGKSCEVRAGARAAAEASLVTTVAIAVLILAFV